MRVTDWISPFFSCPIYCTTKWQTDMQKVRMNTHREQLTRLVCPAHTHTHTLYTRHTVCHTLHTVCHTRLTFGFCSSSGAA